MYLWPRVLLIPVRGAYPVARALTGSADAIGMGFARLTSLVGHDLAARKGRVLPESPSADSVNGVAGCTRLELNGTIT